MKSQPLACLLAAKIICLQDRVSRAFIFLYQQESIPVGCVPPACQLYCTVLVALVAGGGYPRSQGGWVPNPPPTYPPPPGYSPPRHTYPTPCGIHWRHIHPHPNRMTDTCEKITFPQLRWRAGNIRAERRRKDSNHNSGRIQDFL